VPGIENPKKLAISPEIMQVITTMFENYRRVILRKEFGYGLSGSRVIEVRPIKSDGTPELPVIVKTATISLIQKEWQAYQQHIHHRLPYRAEIRAKPVLLPKIGWGGLRYTLMGGNTFEVVSLRDFCHRREVSTEVISTVFQRLLRIMDNLWSYSHIHESFSLLSSYEYLLPVNLLIKDEPLSPEETPQLIDPGVLPQQPIRPGDYVNVSGFIIHKANPTTQTMTLKCPDASLTNPAYYLRYNSPSLGGEDSTYSVDQTIDRIEGRVIETRMSRLHDEVRKAFGGMIDPTGQTISLAPWSEFNSTNPLTVLPSILEQLRTVNVSTIHGDFNFENILVEPETGSVNVIDFADAREDHILHDLLRMEAEVLTKLLPEILHRHQLPLVPALVSIYWQLQMTVEQPMLPHPEINKPWKILTAIRQTARKYLFDPNDLSEYYQGLILYLLGALKFKNLDSMPEHPLPKQVAFWGAVLAYELLINLSEDASRPPESLRAILAAQSSNVVPSQQPKMASPISPPSLGEAEQRLVTLPLEAIPTLASLPVQSRMPLSRNPLFVGRQADLRKLARALKGGETIAIGQVGTTATTGLGGIGKTQLASEFVHRYSQFFVGGVFWLSFADPKAIPAEIAACGGVGAMELRPNFGELSLEDQIRLVMAAWQEPIPRLLVFDNCEEPELLAQWRPPSGGCRILVTSRRADWEPALGVQALPLDVLQRDESLTLLREHCPDADDETLNAIAAEVGDLPLALHLAGSYMARYRRVITPAQYLEQLQDPALLEHPSLKGLGVSPTGHVQNVYRTIALSHDQLDSTDPTGD